MSHTCLTRTAAIAATALVLSQVSAAPALASAHKCKGDSYSSCVEVNGSKRHVNWIKSRIALPFKKCLRGHSQVLINGAHYADSNSGRDAEYCSRNWWGDERTTDTWTVDRSYAKGTQICAKFWTYTGTGPTNGYTNIGTACATVG